MVSLYLNNPGLDKEGRDRIIKERCSKLDGKSGERLANFILGQRICYLNHNVERETGAGRFCSSLVEAVGKTSPSAVVRVLSLENGLPAGKFRLLFSFNKIRKAIQACDIVHALDAWPYGFIAVLASWGL